MDTIVCDIDGVLADNSRRYARMDRDNPDWRAFHVDQHEDPLLEAQAVLLRLLRPHHRIVLLTARREAYREQTIEWLTKHQIEYDFLEMRQQGDSLYGFKPARIRHMVDMYSLNVRLVIDDDPKNCEIIREMGIPVLYIHSGYYEENWAHDVAVFQAQEAADV